MASRDFGGTAASSPRKTIDQWMTPPARDLSLVSHVRRLSSSAVHTLLKQPDHYQLLTFRPDRYIRPAWMEMRPDGHPAGRPG